MPRTITVKGVGKTSAKVDCVVLSMELEAQDVEYDRAMVLAAAQIDQLSHSLISIGFAKDAVKTTNFTVHTNYEQVKDANGDYINVLKGFVCSHSLKLQFDWDSGRLASALDTVANCIAHPQLRVAFTVKDPTTINDALLKQATLNARKKAELLCDASGVVLGQLLTIDYSWAETSPHSNTRYNLADRAAPMMAKAISIEPEDITLSDNATFVWEIM